MGPLLPPVLLILAALSTTNCVTMQTVSTTMATTSPSITTPSTRVATSSDNMTTKTTKLVTTPTGKMESEKVPLTVSIDNGETLFRPVGSDATITCSVSGSGTINVVWIGPVGNTLTNNTKYTETSYDINTGKSTLTIFATSTTDSGLYTCRATDISGSTVQDSITLTVSGTTSPGMTTGMITSKQETPASATATHTLIPTTSNNQTVLQRLVSTTVPLTVSIDNGETLFRPVGSDATIKCSVSGSGTISVVWIGAVGNILTSNTKYIVTSYDINTGKSTLTIFALSMNDSGLYTCRATDVSGFAVQDSITLTAYGTTSPGMTTGMTTSKQETPASATATHTLIPTTSNNQTVLQRLVSTTVPLTVYIDNGETLFRPVGSDATITCSVSRSGTISVVWIGPVGNILTSNTKYIVTSYDINTGKSTLTIFALSTTDSGSYTCRATDVSGSAAQDSITLTAYGTTSPGMTTGMTTSKQEIQASATATHTLIPTTSNNQTVLQRLVSTTVPLTVSIDNGETLFRPVGSDATITCSVSGSGTISVVWIGPVGNILTSNTKYTVTSYDINTGKSTLTIFALSTTDSGSYTCRATDVSGSTMQDSIKLTAYGTTSPGMTTGMTTSKQETPASATATHTLIPTTSNNQTVLQRLVSTTVPLTVSIDNGETLFRPVGSDATITCSVSRSGTISVVWIGPVGNILTSNTKYTVTSYDINTGKSTLTIFALSTTDSGLYTCRATDVSGSAAQDSITLTAYGTTSPGMTTGMTTSKQETPASATATHTLIPTTSNNQTVLQRLVSTTVPLTVSIDNGETLFRPVGSDATITCSVSGSGTISVVWIGPVGNILTSNTKYTVTSYNINTGKSTLTIFALSTTDSGSYTCRATDVSGSAAQDSITLTAYGTTSPGMTTGMTTSKQETPASATATHTLIPTTSNNQTVLQRLVSPTVPLTVSIDNGETLFRPVGSDATITCSVSGSGTISVVWIGAVGNILTSNTKYTVTSYDINTGKSTLTIFALSTTDSGSYTCRATDVSGSTMQDSIKLTAYGTTSSGLTPDMTTSKQDMITTAPATTTSTHNMIPTVSNNQTATTGTTLQTMATTSPHMTTPVLEMTTPIKNTVALMSSIATTTNVHTIKPTTGQTSLAVTSLSQNMTVRSPLMSNSTQDMTTSTLTDTTTSIRKLNTTAGTSLPAMATGQSNIATAAQVSTTSTNTMTPVPITPKTTSQKTDLATGIPEQSSTCCFNENMVIMLQKNVPVVNGYVPFVSILEETNGTDVSVCDTKVLLKAAFKRSNQTVSCQGCTSVPQCGNQMLKIDLWMSPNKTGFSFHIGDSKTNDGYGGDDSTQENDAEFHFYNLEQRLYGSDKCSNMSEFLMGLPNTTTHWVTIYIGNEFIRVSNPLGYSYELCSNCLFALNGQSDSRGTVNQDIYIGLNRIIRNSYFGDGSGVCGAVISWACPWKT